MIHTDCSLYHKDPFTNRCFCTGLTEMMCANGPCKFYKTKGQLLAQNLRCEERLRQIKYERLQKQKTVKEHTYELFSQW